MYDLNQFKSYKQFKISFYDPINPVSSLARWHNHLFKLNATLEFPKNIWGLQLPSALTSSNVARNQSVSLPEDDTILQALTTKPNFIYFKATQHFRIHWICLRTCGVLDYCVSYSIHSWTGLQISQKILWKSYDPHRPSTPMASLLSQVGQVGKECCLTISSLCMNLLHWKKCETIYNMIKG